MTVVKFTQKCPIKAVNIFSNKPVLTALLMLGVRGHISS